MHRLWNKAVSGKEDTEYISALYQTTAKCPADEYLTANDLFTSRFFTLH